MTGAAAAFDSAKNTVSSKSNAMSKAGSQAQNSGKVVNVVKKKKQKNSNGTAIPPSNSSNRDSSQIKSQSKSTAKRMTISGVDNAPSEASNRKPRDGTV